MRAMILAAGKGERARPLSERIPKPLFPVNGSPVISYGLGLLKSAGITEVIVNVHHLADQIEETLSHVEGMTIHLSHEGSLLETGGGIAKARGLIGNDTFLVLNGDVICDVDLKAVIDDHTGSGSVATMVLRENENPTKYAPVELETESRVVKDLRGDIGYSSTTSRSMLYTGVAGARTDGVRLPVPDEGIHRRRILSSGDPRGASDQRICHFELLGRRRHRRMPAPGARRNQTQPIFSLPGRSLFP